MVRDRCGGPHYNIWGLRGVFAKLVQPSSLGVVLSRLAAAYSLLPNHVVVADLRRHDLISPPHLYPLYPHFPRFRGHLSDSGGKFGSAGRESRLPHPGFTLHPESISSSYSLNRFLNDDCLILGSLEQWLEYCPEGGISSLITCGPAPSASSHVVSHTPNPFLIPVQRSVSCPTQVASYPRGRSPMVGLTRKSSSPRLMMVSWWFGSGCYVEGECMATKVMKESREKECIQQLLNAKTEVKSIDLDSAPSIDFLFN